MVTKVNFVDVINFLETKLQERRFFYLHTLKRLFYVNSALMFTKEDYKGVLVLIQDAVDTTKIVKWKEATDAGMLGKNMSMKIAALVVNRCGVKF